LYEIDGSVASPTPNSIVLGDPSATITVGWPSFDIRTKQIIVGTEDARVYGVSIPLKSPSQSSP
jgi:hypothetical protein